MNDLNAASRDIVFILGAGRSGTTLLYKLLCLNEDVAFVSNFDNRLGSLACLAKLLVPKQSMIKKRDAWFNRAGNAYYGKRPSLKKIQITPDEGVYFYARSGIPSVIDIEVEPTLDQIELIRRSFNQLAKSQRANLLITKRTANNRRIPFLLKAFPNAKFINLIRDGRDVAFSLSSVEWWNDHTLWWSGKTPKQMVDGGCDQISLCAKNWLYEAREVEQGLIGVDQAKVINVRYEELVAGPIPILQEIFHFLNKPLSRNYINCVKSISLTNNSKWRANWTEEQTKMVMDIQRPSLIEQGYIQG